MSPMLGVTYGKGVETRMAPKIVEMDKEEVMWCMQCKKDLVDCTCPDIKERLAKIFDHPNLAARWCKKCDNHYSQCKCEQPEWIIK